MRKCVHAGLVFAVASFALGQVRAPATRPAATRPAATAPAVAKLNGLKVEQAEKLLGAGFKLMTGQGEDGAELWTLRVYDTVGNGPRSSTVTTSYYLRVTDGRISSWKKDIQQTEFR